MDQILAIDFGTSHTVAILRNTDGRARRLLFDGSPMLRSAVHATAGGELLVGRDAIHMSRLEPASYEPNPKRRVDDGNVLLGAREFAVVDLFAAVLHRVVTEAHRMAGTVPPAVLTYPAAWGERRRSILHNAATRAGLTIEGMVPEPVAAATYFTSVLGNQLAEGQAVAVFDFGGGTLDVAVVRRTAEGMVVAAHGGLDDLGGLDIDALVVSHAANQVAPHAPEAWQRLASPRGPEDLRDRTLLWDDARSAKEMLTRANTASIHVPGYPPGTHLTRAELDAMAAPVLRRAVGATATVIGQARLRDSRELAGLFLVGGSSRMPLVAHLLHTELGIPPTVLEQPETAVAEGALHTPEAKPPVSETLATALDEIRHRPAEAAGPGPVDIPVPRRRRWLLAAAAAVVLLLAVGVAVVVRGFGSNTNLTSGGSGTNGNGQRSGGAAPPGGGSAAPGAGPAFEPRNPSAVARDAKLKTFTTAWDGYPTWGDGCRQPPNGDTQYRPNGKVGSAAAVAEPAEVVHCRTDSFDAVFALYASADAARKVREAYAKGSGASVGERVLLPKMTSGRNTLMWALGSNPNAVGWISMPGEKNTDPEPGVLEKTCDTYCK